MTTAMVRRDFFNAETEIVGLDDDLGQYKKRLGGQIDPVECVPAPGLGPIIIVDTDPEEIV